ncbi:tetratricopeptide repeat protein [Roseivirga pacifica]|uniref:tetratricopeptide repeat protein n=1 Tax=Roseivirga pacifica TaxID=1267423 RepID=UPI00227BD66F|nr:tetratricopeptide repeat protein [Roseivirga pacifica]
MKRIKLFGFILVLLASAEVAVLAQDSTYVSNEYAKAMAVYQRAQRYNDAALTKQALVDMSILAPRDTGILRSLAELYYNNQQYVSSAMAAADITRIYPNSLVGIEIQALSYENLRLYDKALEQYEKLWLTTDDNNVLYQMAYLQYSIKRYTEAITNIDILATKITDESTVTLSKSDGNVQEIKFSAALKNLKGLVFSAQGNKEEARKLFNEALAINPDFDAAKSSLAELDKG